MPEPFDETTEETTEAKADTWPPDERDRAIAEFFQELTKLLKAIMPLVLQAIKEKSE